MLFKILLYSHNHIVNKIKRKKPPTNYQSKIMWELLLKELISHLKSMARCLN